MLAGQTAGQSLHGRASRTVARVPNHRERPPGIEIFDQPVDIISKNFNSLAGARHHVLMPSTGARYPADFLDLLAKE